MRLRLLPLLFFCLSASVIVSLPGHAHAQNQPLGRWRSHLPYDIALGIATDGRTLYVAGEKAFFTLNTATGEYDVFSKVNGMHDVGMEAIGWDDATGTAILAYENSNIDLYRNHSFTNIPEIKLRSFAGSKVINHIYTDNGMAYLSTGLGIVVLNLSKAEVKETYMFSKGGQMLTNTAFTASGAYFYAATSKGLYRNFRNSNTLLAFSSWQTLDSTRAFTGLAAVGGQVFVTGSDSLFAVTPTGLQFIYSSGGSTTHLDAGGSVAYLSEFHANTGRGVIKIISPATLRVLDSLRAGYPRGVTNIGPDVWVADQYNGLSSYDGQNGIVTHIPNGPRSYTNFNILAHDGDVWVAHGGYDDFFNGRQFTQGLSHYSGGSWSHYSTYEYPLFGDSVRDVVALAKDPADGTLYAGTMASGLIAIHPDGSSQIYKQGILEPDVNGAYAATSLAFDKGGNLWVTNSGAQRQLAVRTPAGQWYHYSNSCSGNKANAGIGLLIDDNNQKWYYVPQGVGVAVYNDNSTLDDTSDDGSYCFSKGKGFGNLPSGNVQSIIKDRQGAIWVGTADGIGIISCAADAVARTCEAEIRIVQYDQFAGYLFAGEAVRTIAVDGANRKWIGTGNGVWLISPEGDKIILRFTIDNSPLPSNNIQKISIDPVTGDVYIGTDAGLVSYRGTATEGGETNASPILTFPNPVPSGYSGSIAIRGLVTDADVRITDISGQLIYRTKAAGGQAVWNGLDYTGHRPQSGVLLIFASDKAGTQTTTGKILYQH